MTPNSSTLARPKRRSPVANSPGAMFLKGFFKHPVMVGALVPSSGKVISRVLDRVDWSACKVLVEYGPGVGTFCQPVLDRMAPDAQLIAIDTNEDFIAYLRETIRDSRFSPVLGSAADVEKIVADHGHSSADYALSGLPFSTLPPGVGDQIGAATARVIRPGGAFMVYQYSPKCRDFIAPYFDRIEHAMEWWNLPPAQIYWAWKD